MPTDFMNRRANHNCGTVAAAVPAASLNLAGDAPASTESIRHIYVHIPFCARICPYCAFYKELIDRSQTNRFCKALLRELQQHAEDRPASRPPGSRLDQSAGSPSSFYLHDGGERAISIEGAAGLRPVRRHLLPSTIYFGGGTPTALTIAQLEFILRGFHEQLDLSQLIEWTMEANPGSV